MSHDFEDIETDSAEVRSIGARLQATISVDGSVTTKLLPASGELTLGRGSTCDLVVSHVSVSRHHATLRLSPLEIIDTGSRNGTFVRGKNAQVGVPVRVHVGDAIQVGDAAILIQSVHSRPPVENTDDNSVLAPSLDSECLRSARTGAPFAVVQIVTQATNDEDVYRLVRAFVRNTDVVTRDDIGGFRILLIDTASEDAAIAVARMTEHLREHRVSAKLGFARYPLDGVVAEQLIAHAYEQLERAPGAPPSETDKIRELVRNVARGDLSVLITGETGVGKELCAEMIHRLSPRAAKPFVKLNCSALVDSLIETELFGHERGAFTGATSARAGLLETGNGGTVFLDEIGELPLGVQAKLLRVLEDQVVRRVGASTGKKIDVRFVAATNRDLADDVAAGRFRSDLYYRINGVSITIPALRERRTEIRALARAFASRARAGTPIVLRPEVLAALEHHSWPGNVRELRNTVERAVLVAAGRPLEPSHLGLAQAIARESRPTLPLIPAPVAPPPRPSSEFIATADTEPPQRLSDQSLANEVAELERKRILEALERFAGNQTQAARALGMSRGTLIARMESYAIRRPRKREG